MVQNVIFYFPPPPSSFLLYKKALGVISHIFIFDTSFFSMSVSPCFLELDITSLKFNLLKHKFGLSFELMYEERLLLKEKNMGWRIIKQLMRYIS